MAKKSFTLTLENNKTEKEALNFLINQDSRFYLPSLKQKKKILNHLDIDHKYVKAFDLILLKEPLTTGSIITEKQLKECEIIEVKSTKKHLPNNPKGFFFGATENEFNLVEKVEAKNHTIRFCFVCLNQKSKSYELLTIKEVEKMIQSKRTQYQIHFKK